MNHKGNKMDTNKFLERQRERQAQQAERQANQKSQIPFLKLPQGKHPVRFLRVGNKQEKLPFKSVQTHTFKLKSDAGQTIFVYALCYNWLFTHRDCKELTINPLREMGKLTAEDIKAVKKYGCPVCNAKDVLYKSGADKETWQSCNTRGTNYWNVLLRSDEKVYIWSVSDTNHDAIAGSIEMYMDINEKTGKPGPDSIDILHPKTGYDHIITATGERNNRRYKVDVKPKPRPVGDLDDDQKPLDLMVVVAESFKPYGEMCQLLRRMVGKELARLGFDYGVALPEERKKRVDDDEDDDDFEEPKSKKNSNHLNIDDDDDDDEDTPPKKSVKKNGSSSSKSVGKKGGDEDDSDPWNDDDEEEEVPVKKSSKKSELTPKKSTRSVEEDTEDDEEDDDEDEDIEQDDDYDEEEVEDIEEEDDEEEDDEEEEEETYMKGGNLYNKRTGKRIL